MADSTIFGRSVLDRLISLEVAQFGSVVGFPDTTAFEQAVLARLSALEIAKVGQATVEPDTTSFTVAVLARLTALESGGGGGGGGGGSTFGGVGTNSAPTLGYPTTANPPTISISLPVDGRSGDVLKLASSASPAMTSPAILTHTVTDADLVAGTISIGIPTLVGITYFQALLSVLGVDSANKSNIVAWGDSVAPAITTSATQTITETSPLAVALTVTDTGGVPALVSDGTTAGWYIAGGADQLQFQIGIVGGAAKLQWIANGSQAFASPLDAGANNVYDVLVGAVDYGGNLATPLAIATTVTQIDTTPDAFTFTDVTGAVISTLYTSNTVTLSGLQVGFAIPATVTGGEYQKNGGTWTAAGSLTVQNGDTMAVRITSSANAGTSVGSTLSIGSGPGFSEAFSVRTAGVASFSDNFNDNSRDVTKWNIAQFHNGASTTGCTVAETNARLEATPPVGGGVSFYDGYVTVNTYDFTGDQVFVNLSHSGTPGAQQESLLSVGFDDHNNYNAIVSGSVMYLQKIVSGTSTTIGGTVAYNSSTHAWIRIRHGGAGDDTIYFDTAPSTAANPPAPGDWVNQKSAARDAGVAITAAHFALQSGTYSSTTVATAQFDGFNGAT